MQSSRGDKEVIRSFRVAKSRLISFLSVRVEAWEPWYLSLSFTYFSSQNHLMILRERTDFYWHHMTTFHVVRFIDKWCNIVLNVNLEQVCLARACNPPTSPSAWWAEQSCGWEQSWRHQGECIWKASPELSGREDITFSLYLVSCWIFVASRKIWVIFFDTTFNVLSHQHSCHHSFKFFTY